KERFIAHSAFELASVAPPSAQANSSSPFGRTFVRLVLSRSRVAQLRSPIHWSAKHRPSMWPPWAAQGVFGALPTRADGYAGLQGPRGVRTAAGGWFGGGQRVRRDCAPGDSWRVA